MSEAPVDRDVLLSLLQLRVLKKTTWNLLNALRSWLWLCNHCTVTRHGSLEKRGGLARGVRVHFDWRTEATLAIPILGEVAYVLSRALQSIVVAVAL